MRQHTSEAQQAASAPSNTDDPSTSATISHHNNKAMSSGLSNTEIVTQATFADLVARGTTLVGTGERRILLGVTGSPGAGKTTLVQALVAALRHRPPPRQAPGEWVAQIPMDGFHLADTELRRLGRLGRKGAADTFDAYGYLELLRRLRADEPFVVYAPAFERDLEQPLAGAIPIPPTARLILTEGNYLLLDEDPWPAIAAELDEIWYCAQDDETRHTRLIARHVAFGKEPAFAAHWVHAVDEANARLISTSQTRADLVVSSEILNHVSPPLLGGPKSIPP